MIGTEILRFSKKSDEDIIVSPKSVRIQTDRSTISPSELERAYKTDSIIYNAINKRVQIIMSAGYTIEGDDSSVSYIEEFIDNVGNRGGTFSWESLIATTLRNNYIFGKSFCEIISTKGGKIVDLDLIDPKTMDYAKDTAGRVVLDKESNPVGYVQKLMKLVPGGVVSLKPPKNVYLGSNQIYLPRENVVHFMYITLSDTFSSIGLIHPIYYVFRCKERTEDGLANASYRAGFPLLWGKVGDEEHEPGEEQIRDTLDKLANLTRDHVMSTPHWVDIKLLESSHPNSLRDYLDYYAEAEVAGLGVPKAYATESGEATNRATLNRQEYLMKIALKRDINKVCRTIEKQLFAKIAKQENLKSVPKIKWGEIALEELDSKAKRLAMYSQFGLITPSQDIEKVIRKIEKLPIDGDLGVVGGDGGDKKNES